ncbi:MAG: sensor histidine kinase [Burkholderiales bacterium]
MLSTTTPRKRSAAAARHTATPKAGSASMPAHAVALARLGDAVALINRRSRQLCWASDAWRALLPQLADSCDIAALEPHLAGLGAALDADGDDGAPRRLELGDSAQWGAELVSLDRGDWLLRLTDRREQGRALQRQLDDREQLLFTSRVFSVGEMATTLAHELNQPIGATANLLRGLRSRLARRKPALDGEESGALERAIEQVMFAARVITRIREFTHSHQPRHGRVDLAALLRASASLLDWDLRRSRARLQLHLPEGAVLVRGDEVMLQQVLVNLMRNALDAMRADPPEDPQLTLTLALKGQEAVVQVCDNGCGLGDDAAAKLFVPFASSKPNGMGIGLSICRSFVELHQGRLWFTRNAERGATFHVGLPLMKTPSPTATATSAP